MIGLIALVFHLLAAPVLKVETQNQYGAVNIEALDAVGLIRLNGTTVTNQARITGSLISQNATIGSIDIIGEANLTGTQVKNGGYVMGSLQAVRSTFEKSITILSQKALFTASKLEGITIKQDGSYKGKQIVELKQGTIINGPIHFESGKGEVIVFPGCQVLGSVTGGKIVKKS